MRMKLYCVVLCMGIAAAAAPAVAQSAPAESEDYRARIERLVSLSRIFGEMHHLRRMCAPARESDVWRERMKNLVALEEPSFDIRDRMVAAFNDGYRAATNRFDACTRDAEDVAAARAAEGGALVAALAAPLRYQQDVAAFPAPIE